MKLHQLNSILVFISFFFVVLFSSCKKTEMTKFSGQVTDAKGNAVPSGKAVIYAWGENAKEPQEIIIDLKDGKLGGELPIAKKYVVNIHAKGYGFVSKVFYSVPTERNYELKKATEISINPSVGGVITDTQNNCPGSLSFRANWTANPMAGIPVQLNADGKVSGLGMPEELNDAYYYHAKTGNCNNGINVSLPPNSIAASGAVTVSMSIIDLSSPDGMPGDNTADFGNGTAYMESFGAFSLEIYDNDKTYNLNKERGGEATVSFPANMFTSKKELPKRIPLLSYNEKSGVWISENFAELDTLKKVYVGKVSHFSAINLDIEKTNPACIRFKDDASDGFNPPYQVEVTQPAAGGGAPFVRSRSVTVGDLNCATPNDRQFALTRLLPNTYTSVVFFNGTSPKGIYVVKSAATNAILQNPMQPDCSNLGLCGNFKLFDKNSIDFVNSMASHDTLIAACRDGANIVISIASKNSFTPTGYKINIENTGGCNGDHLLSTLTLLAETTPAPPVINFKTFKYQLSCPGVGLDETIILLKPSGLKSSNKILIAPSCTP